MTFGSLHSYSLLKISGTDAPTFLQGQLTNDINLLDSQWQLTGYCSPKGRLLALFKLWKTDTNEFHALLSKDLTESTVKRLRMFVMRSDVEITIIEKTMAGFNSIDDLIEYNPDYSDCTENTNEKSVTALESNDFLLKLANRYLLISDQDNINDSFDTEWLAGNISTGLPQINVDTVELFIPQMINLDILDGINFKKGCYTGQEIVARMHYLGKLKQRMFVCKISEGVSCPSPGDKVYNLSNGSLDNRKTIGNIVSATKESNLFLAVLRLDNIDNGLYLASGDKFETLDSQPYPLPD